MKLEISPRESECLLAALKARHMEMEHLLLLCIDREIDSERFKKFYKEEVDLLNRLKERIEQLSDLESTISTEAQMP
jgi:hypothetical protein